MIDEPQNGPRMLNPTLIRHDYFHHHDYTLRIAGAVDVRLTDRQARDLYQQLYDEFKPKAVLSCELIGPRCVYCGHGVANPGDSCGMCAGSRAEQSRRST